VFTLNNHTEDELSSLKNLFESTSSVKYLLFQEEQGHECDTRHLQGYIVFKSNQRLSGVRALVERAHWECARGGHEACVAYHSKQDTRTAGPWEFGEHGRPGQRTDLERAAELLRGGHGVRAVARDLPAVYIRYSTGVHRLDGMLRRGERRAAIEAIVYYGDTGVGKTHRVHEEAGEDLYSPIVTKDKVWFDNYDGERSILFDDYNGEITLTYFLRILDKYPLAVEVKGGTAWARWEKVYITSNLHPTEWYPLARGVHERALLRRLKISEMGKWIVTGKHVSVISPL